MVVRQTAYRTERWIMLPTGQNRRPPIASPIPRPSDPTTTPAGSLNLRSDSSPLITGKPCQVAGNRGVEKTTATLTPLASAFHTIGQIGLRMAECKVIVFKRALPGHRKFRSNRKTVPEEKPAPIRAPAAGRSLVPLMRTAGFIPRLSAITINLAMSARNVSTNRRDHSGTVGFSLCAPV